MHRTIGWCVIGALALMGCGSDSGGSGRPTSSGGSSSGGSSGGGSGGGSGASGSVGGGAPSATCSAYCATAHSLDCSNDSGDDSSCTQHCEIYRSGLSSCLAQGDAFMKCVANDPSTLVCDDEGLPSLGELSSDACGAQWNDLMACWCVGQAASGPPADQQAAVEACEYNCEEMANLSCADPSCTQACGQLGPMQLGWPAIAAMAECQSTFTSSDYECTADGVSQVKDGMGFACIGPVHAALICSLAMLAVCDVTMCEAECSDNLCLNLPMSTACKTCVETKYFAAP